ncbi:hypothetical protein [Streptomyces griseoluteus]|uniref:hypothetical protein n=1 Tax=Streptomyces griseoluteus TaxID=29306 RepID=UPI00368F3FED
MPAVLPCRERKRLLPAQAASVLVGALMGGATWSLTVRARSYCDAGYDAGGRFELNLLLPVLVTAGAAAGLASWSIGQRLAGGVRLPTLSVAVVTIGLAWWFFAARGTLADYPGDSVLCPEVQEVSSDTDAAAVHPASRARDDLAEAQQEWRAACRRIAGWPGRTELPERPDVDSPAP